MINIPEGIKNFIHDNYGLSCRKLSFKIEEMFEHKISHTTINEWKRANPPIDEDDPVEDPYMDLVWEDICGYFTQPELDSITDTDMDALVDKLYSERLRYASDKYPSLCAFRHAWLRKTRERLAHQSNTQPDEKVSTKSIDHFSDDPIRKGTDRYDSP